ncbi:hypothetical protein ANO11243_009020 [Dothideomycetidae sp. 11243]|nr:hypothetical protein ANO11243_009020 [fungal sp. No.11243]
MKYGDTLRQRSIAAWQTHNIDYQDIKYFIKTNTTPGKGKAVSIPGKGDVNAEDFENTLFVILKEQDERITCFVRSKFGEIDRRLAHLEQQIERFSNRPSEPHGGRTTVRRIQRYGKIETDILKAGEEIQALSRFIGVQQEAFRKLIKKYKKWTGSSELGYRFDAEVRQRPTSFSQTDLRPLLQSYEELLHAVRMLHQQGKSGQNTQTDLYIDQPPQKTIAASCLRQAQVVVDEGVRVDFDNLLATMPVSESGKEASFWVHPENVVELQILLLQYTRSFNTFRRSSATSTHIPSPTSPTQAWPDASHPDTFDIIADDAQQYLLRRIAEPVSEVGSRIQKAALHARSVLVDDVALLTWAKDSHAEKTEVQTCALKQKFVQSILDPSRGVLSRKASLPHLCLDGPQESPEESIKELQRWIKQHSGVRPIAAINSQRARFFKMSNKSSGVVVAALDQSIQFQSGISTQPDKQAKTFPYAVLSLRQEGANVVDLIKVLDNSHLVERIHGFSLEHHAVWQASQPADIEKPFWIPLLARDLRKVPQPIPRASRKVSSDFGSQSTTPQASTATSSDAGGQYDHGKVHDLSRLDLTTSANPSRAKKRAGRYWNEYDDPSDEEDQYVLYVDPNYESFWDKAWKSVTQKFSAKDKKKPEMESLLCSPDLESGLHDGEESSDDELEPPNYRISRIYGHADAQVQAAGKTTESTGSIPRFTWACFASSIAILIVAFILAATGKRKLHREVDAGVVFAIVTSLTFAITAVATLYRSGQDLRGFVWVIAGMLLCVVATASGGLLAWILT